MPGTSQRLKIACTGISQMFERCTEKARRAIFFARYEVSELHGATIESEHLLLGLFRADQSLAGRVGLPADAYESSRQQISTRKYSDKSIPLYVELPLAQETNSVLSYAAQEADRVGSLHIGTDHLFLGILLVEKCFAAQILHGRGLALEMVREKFSTIKS